MYGEPTVSPAHRGSAGGRSSSTGRVSPTRKGRRPTVRRSRRYGAGVACVGCADLAFDPRHWELPHFSLWDSASPQAVGDRFQVLRVSQPRAGELPSGVGTI